MAPTPAFPATPAALAGAIADALPAIPDAVKHYRVLARRLPAARAMIEDFAAFLIRCTWSLSTVTGPTGRW
jgi:hypothetical protein